MTFATLPAEDVSTELVDCRDDWAEWQHVEACWQQDFVAPETLADLIDRGEIELSEDDARIIRSTRRSKAAKLKITPASLP